MEEVVITFDATIDAIHGEKLLVEAGLKPLVMPLPSQVKAGCGLCLRVRLEDGTRACELLRSHGVSQAGCFIRRLGQGGSTYEEWREGSL